MGLANWLDRLSHTPGAPCVLFAIGGRTRVAFARADPPRPSMQYYVVELYLSSLVGTGICSRQCFGD